MVEDFVSLAMILGQKSAFLLGCHPPGCTPRKCGRGVTDIVITREEAEQIRRYPCTSALCLGHPGVGLSSEWGGEPGQQQSLENPHSSVNHPQGFGGSEGRRPPSCFL
jgi:hypothetical protein